MAASSIPGPGTRLGPCPGACVHSDCRMMRDKAAERCTVCGSKIGYETRYYADERMGEVMGYVHARCAEYLDPTDF